MRTFEICGACVLGVLLCVAAPAAVAADSSSLVLRSDDVAAGKSIPEEFTCDGADRSPSLAWQGVPEGAKAFALVLDDPDAPNGTFLHWVAWNLPSPSRALARAVPTESDLGDGTFQARNDFGRVGYGGPCPPKGSSHTYRFRFFALPEPLDLPPETAAAKVIEAVESSAIAEAELRADYSR